MEKKTIKVQIELVEEMLGMSAKADVHEKFIASKAPDAESREEEVAALGVDTVVESSKTFFPKDEDGNPFMWDYQMRGAFKDACGLLRRVKGSKSSKITAFKKVIDGQIFVKERKIPLLIPEGESIGNCQRPLRAETAQGPRVALSNSETVPAGTMFEFTVVIFEPPSKKGVPSLEECLIEWLEYGEFRGLGQWRNSGKGRFVFSVG
jgi:hypothetical protein